MATEASSHSNPDSRIVGERRRGGAGGVQMRRVPVACVRRCTECGAHSHLLRSQRVKQCHIVIFMAVLLPSTIQGLDNCTAITALRQYLALLLNTARHFYIYSWIQNLFTWLFSPNISLDCVAVVICSMLSLVSETFSSSLSLYEIFKILIFITFVYTEKYSNKLQVMPKSLRQQHSLINRMLTLLVEQFMLLPNLACQQLLCQDQQRRLRCLLNSRSNYPNVQQRHG